MEKNIKDFKDTRLIIVLVSIIIILVFIIGVLIGARFNTKDVLDNKTNTETKENNKKKDRTNTKEKTTEENDSKNEKVKYLGIPHSLCGGVIFPFEERTITIEDLTAENKIGMLINGFGEKIPFEDDVKSGEKEEFYLTEEEIKNYFEDTSFLDIIKNKGEEPFTNIDPVIITYKNGKYYFTTYPTGCEGPLFDGGYIIPEETKKEKGYIISTVRYYYRHETEMTDDNFTYSIYKDSKKTHLIAKGIGDDLDGFKKYIKEMSTYDIYYKIENGYGKFEKMVYNAN